MRINQGIVLLPGLEGEGWVAARFDFRQFDEVESMEWNPQIEARCQNDTRFRPMNDKLEATVLSFWDGEGNPVTLTGTADPLGRRHAAAWAKEGPTEALEILLEER